MLLPPCFLERHFLTSGGHCGWQVNYATHMSNTVLTVQPLESGYSKEIHGQIIIHTSNPTERVHNYKSVLVFRALDTGVKCTALDFNS